MHIKRDSFILREMGGDCYAVPVGEQVSDFRGMIRMNETGAFFWRELEQGITREALLEKMLERYEDLTAKEAARDLEEFLASVSFALEEDGI